VRIFKNCKSNLVRRIFKRDNLEISTKSIVKIIAKIANIYRVTFDDSNCIDNAFLKFLLTNAKNKVIY